MKTLPLADGANVQSLIEKIADLPAERIVEVERFVDALSAHAQHRATVRAAASASAPMFAAVWGNPEDSVYDDL